MKASIGVKRSPWYEPDVISVPGNSKAGCISGCISVSNLEGNKYDYSVQFWISVSCPDMIASRSWQDAHQEMLYKKCWFSWYTQKSHFWFISWRRLDAYRLGFRVKLKLLDIIVQMWIISCYSLCLTMECPCLWSGSTVRRKKSFWGSPSTGSWGCPSTTAITSRPGGSTPSRHGTSTGKPSTWWYRCGHERNFPLFAYSQQKPRKATPAGTLFFF